MRTQTTLSAAGPLKQRGVTLIELMVGLSIGLLVVAVALGALMVSRGVTGTVSDASGIQQQASYAMRIIGQQLRQSGSLFLDLNPSGATTETAGSLALVPVGFVATIGTPGGGLDTFDPATNALGGTASPVALTAGYSRYMEPLFPGGTAQYTGRNCLGGPADTNTTHQRIESTFSLNGSELRCRGNGATAQPLVQNVANFQVRYLLQDNASTPGNPQIRYFTADNIPDADGNGQPDWSRIQAVEVCLVLYGNEAIDMPPGSSYTDCDGSTQVNMTSLTGARARRMHIPFRNVFQLRSQGLVGSAL